MKNKLTIAGIITIVLGVICFIVRSFIPSYVDNSGILHEPFYLVGIGFILLFIGIILVIIGLVTKK